MRTKTIHIYEVTNCDNIQFEFDYIHSIVDEYGYTLKYYGNTKTKTINIITNTKTTRITIVYESSVEDNKDKRIEKINKVLK